jgi:hypothetical protein
MRALVGCVGGLGVLSVRFGCNPTQEAVVTVRSRNYAGPQHFYLFRGMCSAWVPGSVLGSLVREIRAFSSGSALASPSFRDSFVLRDRGHIKGQIRVTPDCYVGARQRPQIGYPGQIRKRSDATTSRSAHRRRGR